MIAFLKQLVGYFETGKRPGEEAIYRSVWSRHAGIFIEQRTCYHLYRHKK
jgi:hypothetical protein